MSDLQVYLYKLLEIVEIFVKKRNICLEIDMYRTVIKKLFVANQ